MTADVDDPDDYTRCVWHVAETCSRDYCHAAYRSASFMSGVRCDATTEGIQFDSTGLPLERGECTT